MREHCAAESRFARLDLLFVRLFIYFFFKSDESSFVGFGCGVIFISFQVLSLFLLAPLFVLRVLFVLGIDV